MTTKKADIYFESFDGKNLVCRVGYCENAVDLYLNGKLLAKNIIKGKTTSTSMDVIVVIDANVYYEEYAVFTLIDQVVETELDYLFCHLPSCLKPDFQMYLDRTSPKLIGWAVDKAWPNRIMELTVEIEGEEFAGAVNSIFRRDLKKAGKSSHCGGFEMESPVPWLWRRKYDLRLRFPDDSHSKTFAIEGQNTGPAPLWELDALRRPVAIVVPIYNAPEDLAVCIERLLRYTPANARYILVNDCSTDERVAAILRKYASLPKFQIISNTQNLGFSGSVNAGMMAAAPDDVVILNSDARVTERWLESLQLAACSLPNVATVTPMSDNAGAFSAPVMGKGNDLPPGAEENEFARAFRRAALDLLPQVPTGNGFCMYIRRHALDDVGLFDAEAFPRGYGEENDFCMRALRKGYVNIIDDRCYVFHASSRSFGAERPELMERGRKVLMERYPEYFTAIGVFSAGAKMRLARWRGKIAQSQWRRLAAPRILFVTGARTGGTPVSTLDLLAEFDARGDCFVAFCDGKEMILQEYKAGALKPLFQHKLARPLNPACHASAEYDAVMAGWIFALDVDIVHVQHLLCQSLNLIGIVKELGRKVSFTFHDYYALSPNLNLVDDAGNFWGKDFAQDSPYRTNIWQMSLPIEDEAYIGHWQKRQKQALLAADAYFFFSEKGRSLVSKTLSGLNLDKMHVVPIGRNFSAFHRLKQDYAGKGKIRILIPGNINYNKGLGIIHRLAAYDGHHAGLLEFHFLGHCLDGRPEGLIEHGPYEQGEFAEKVRQIQPHAGAIFSIWEETWCHTLTELWAVGIPAFVFDLGTVAERVRASGCGWVVPMLDIPELYWQMLEIMLDPAEQAEKQAAVIAWQGEAGREESRGKMGKKYWEVYERILHESEAFVKRGAHLQ